MSTDPLFMKVGTQYYWYHNDHLGTPQMMTTSSGAVAWKAKYTSFGKAAVDSSSTVVNPLRFPGQYEDIETGLHYNWWRYFQPDAGRYLRTDPLRIKFDINLYKYVSNNSINRIDNFGLYDCPFQEYVPDYSYDTYIDNQGNVYVTGIKPTNPRPKRNRQQCENTCATELLTYIVIGSHLMSIYEATTDYLLGPMLDLGTTVNVVTTVGQSYYQGRSFYLYGAESITAEIDTFYKNCMRRLCH